MSAVERRKNVGEAWNTVGVGSAMSWRGVWQPNTDYYEGDLVFTYNGQIWFFVVGKQHSINDDPSTLPTGQGGNANWAAEY